MQKRMKNQLSGVFITITIFVLFACLLFFPVQGFSATASIVINAETGKILQQNNANQLWFPASLTKVMTLYLTFKALKKGQIKLQDKITISKMAASQPKTRLGLKVSETITIEQAILAVATRSANDVAYALAEHQEKTETDFVLKMTRQAKTLGMNNTLFINATGLPDKRQVSTARDMAILAKALIDDFSGFYKYFSASSFRHKKKTYSNFNSLLNIYQGADGIKTGFTCGSGYNLMASAVRNKQRLIAIVLGAKNKYARSKQMVAILNTGFQQMNNVKNTKNITDKQPKSSKPALFVLNCQKSRLVYNHKISGWTIVFGAFSKKAQAKQMIKKVKPKMGKFIKYGGASIIKRKVNGQVLWHALWTGLVKDQAGKTCKILWHAEEYCRVMHPSLFTNKNAQWN